MKSTPIRLLLPLLALLLATDVRAAELTMGVEDLPYLPYYSVEGGEYNGFARELFDTFAAERGHTIHYRPLPVERLYRTLLEGGIDLKFPDNPEWRHDLKEGSKFQYSHAVAPFVDGVMVPPGAAGKPAESLKIGTIRGFTPWPLLGLIEQGRIRLSENNSISGLLRQTIAGRLDGTFINVDVARFHLTNLLRRDGALVLDERLPFTRSAYFVSSIRHPGIIRELSDWLDENAGRVEALQRKWGIGE